MSHVYRIAEELRKAEVLLQMGRVQSELGVAQGTTAAQRWDLGAFESATDHARQEASKLRTTQSVMGHGAWRLQVVRGKTGTGHRGL